MAIARLRPGSFEADCDPSDDVGNYVYVTGPAILGYARVASVDIKTAGMFPAVGVITEKSNATRCLVVFEDIIVDPLASLTAGKTYWVGTDAKATAVLPLAGASERVATQRVGYAIDEERLAVSVDPVVIVRTGA